MPELIIVKINMDKIATAKLFKGQKGTYLDCVLMPNRNGQDEYGQDYFIVQSVSQAERQSGVKGAIIGNAKIHRAKPAAQPSDARSRTAAPAPAPAATEPPPESEDVPF